jgi:hypothetical protein
MADTTPTYSLPFLELADAPDLASATEDLALAVEGELARIDANVAAINALATVRDDEPTDEAAYSGTTWIPGSTPCAVAFTAPPSGAVIVHLKAYFQSNINDKGVFVDSEIKTGATLGSGTVVSGGTANSNDGLVLSGTVTSGVPLKHNSGTFKLITGLTPGSSYNARVMYVTETGGNITMLYRQLVVVPQL